MLFLLKKHFLQRKKIQHLTHILSQNILISNSTSISMYFQVLNLILLKYYLLLRNIS
jgi:hypothetical protein